jgi:hypothetical protein
MSLLAQLTAGGSLLFGLAAVLHASSAVAVSLVAALSRNDRRRADACRALRVLLGRQDIG